jgi:hypothetical protein
MAYSTTVPILGGLAILAAVTGVSLGRSAVAEINPVYFQPASSHFYSDMVPYRSAGSVESDLSGGDYVQADQAYSAAGCAGCADYPVAYRPSHDPAVDGVEDDWSASAPRLADQASSKAEAPEPPPANRQWIERYTTYTVASEPVVEAEATSEVQVES